MVAELLIILLQHFNRCLLKQEASPFLEVFLRFLALNLSQITRNKQDGTLTKAQAVAPFSRGLPPGTDPACPPVPLSLQIPVPLSCTTLAITVRQISVQACSYSLCSVHHSEPRSVWWFVKMFYALIQKAWLQLPVFPTHHWPVWEAVTQDKSSFYFIAPHLLTLSVSPPTHSLLSPLSRYS